MTDLLPNKAIDVEITDEMIAQKIKEVTQKLMGDIRESGFVSQSSRLKDMGQYANTLGIVENGPQGELRVHLLQHGVYSTDKPDRPYWSNHNLIYWLDKDNTLGITDMGLQIEESGPESKTEFKVYRDNEKLELNNTEKNRYLNILLIDTIKATPNPVKTEDMRIGIDPKGVGTSYVRDLIATNPKLNI